MADSIDVNKLKNDAFNAIDALFVEDDESEESPPIESAPPIEEQAKQNKSELIVTSMDDFSILDEFILALDWEYSEAEIKKFVEHLKNIEAQNSDPYNQALVKMLNSIVSYLIKAKNKAYPETFNKLSELIGVLKQINAPGMTVEQIKTEVSAAYQKVKQLKNNISEYNTKLERNVNTTDRLMPRHETKSQPEAVEKTGEVETIQSDDFIEDGDIFREKTQAAQPVTGVIEPSDLEEIESKIIDRLNQYEQRLVFLEKQNQALKQIITDQRQVDSAANGDIGILQPAAAPFEDNDDFGFDDFAAEFETLSPIEESEPVTMDIEEIIYKNFETQPETGSNFGNDSVFQPDGEAFPDVSGDKSTDDEIFSTGNTGRNAISGVDEPASKSSGAIEAYVRIFEVDDQKIAIPIDYFNNFYKLPTKIRNRIYEMESIRLGDLSSFFRKLSRNMKGDLKTLKEKELKKITAQVNTVIKDRANYQFGVLCSCENQVTIIPVSGKHGSGDIVIGKRNDMENRLSQFSVSVADDIIPLIIPC